MDTWLLDKVFCKTWGSILKMISHCSGGDKYENCIDLIPTISIFDFGMFPSVVFFFHFITYIKLKISNIFINVCYYSRQGLGLCSNLLTIYLKEIIYEMKILSEMIRNYKYQCNVLLLHQRPPSNTLQQFTDRLNKHIQSLGSLELIEDSANVLEVPCFKLYIINKCVYI